MLRCALTDLVDLQTRPARFAREVAARPLASRLARLQALSTDRVVNLCRMSVNVDDFDRLLLGLLDGTRTRSELLEAVEAAVAADDFSVYHNDQRVSDPATVAEALRAQVDAVLALRGVGAAGNGGILTETTPRVGGARDPRVQLIS